MATDRGKGARRKGEDDLFQLPLAEFTAARNALAAKLKKAGEAEAAERIKSFPKPSLSAWVANQLYWRHREAFDQLLTAGERFRNAQATQLAGRSADLRAPLDARREAMAQLVKLAAEMLRESGHPSAPDTMRRITSTLEALATYGGHVDGPLPGRLTGDVEPPGFEALAALVPRGGSQAGDRTVASRIIPFNQRTRNTAAGQKVSPEEEARRREEERRDKQAEARKALLEAEDALNAATRAAEHARAEMKRAAALAKEAERAKALIETRYEKAAAAADAARQEARRVASQAEEAAQAMDDAERAVATARTALEAI